MSRWDLVKNLDEAEEDCVLKKFPGGKCEDLSWYAKHHLNKIRPYRFILVVGTNDLPSPRGVTPTTEEEIAGAILDIGRVARSYGVQEIYISSIIDRRGSWFMRRILKVNSILEAGCLQEGFRFLKNDDIFLDFHMNSGGLHLNDFGTAVLKMKILRCFTSFNPFFNDFVRIYDEAS